MGNNIKKDYGIINIYLKYDLYKKEGQEFIFHPSEKNYSRELIDTGEIIEQEGCLFL